MAVAPRGKAGKPNAEFRKKDNKVVDDPPVEPKRCPAKRQQRFYDDPLINAIEIPFVTRQVKQYTRLRKWICPAFGINNINVTDNQDAQDIYTDRHQRMININCAGMGCVPKAAKQPATLINQRVGREKWKQTANSQQDQRQLIKQCSVGDMDV